MRSLYIRAMWALVLFAIAAGTVFAKDGFETMRFLDWRLMIKEAHLANERDNKPRAFELYQRNACAGDKNSQFALGTLYLMGEGTAPDGMQAYAWYRVAAESGEPDYRKAVQNVEALIPGQHRAAADALARDYIARYGSAATGVTCEKRAEPGTRITRLECTPNIEARTSYVEAKLCE
jgi:hypothetical protein